MALWLTTRIFWIACCALVSYALPLTDEKDLMLYLKKIGYLDKTSNLETVAIRAKEALSTAIVDSPKYTGLSEAGELGNESIAMMNMPLYDVKDNTERSTRRKRHRPGPPMCIDSHIDAITRTASGSVFAFQGDHYWQLLDNDTAEGYPSEIDKDWETLEGDLDAAFTLPNGDTYFFKGPRCWKFYNKEKYENFPKTIYDTFEGKLPNDINAAFYWEKDKKIYVFKGSQYWQYDKTADPPVDPSYPKPFRGWRNLALEKIDATIQWDDHITYFFKDNEYYKYHNEICRGSDQLKNHSIANTWFGCS